MPGLGRTRARLGTRARKQREGRGALRRSLGLPHADLLPASLETDLAELPVHPRPGLLVVETSSSGAFRGKVGLFEGPPPLPGEGPGCLRLSLDGTRLPDLASICRPRTTLERHESSSSIPSNEVL